MRAVTASSRWRLSCVPAFGTPRASRAIVQHRQPISGDGITSPRRSRDLWRENPNDWRAIITIDAAVRVKDFASQPEILLAGEDDARFQRNAPVQILDIVVHKPDAPGSDKMTDGFWRIGAVYQQPGLIQQQCACAE